MLGAQGLGSNLVDGNTVTDNGRFGIEIKNPSGTGATSGPGSVVVSNNAVSRSLAAVDARDYAGIAVFRRSPDPLLNVDQPSGVAITDNEVSGYHRKLVGSTGDGLGIVVEGTNNTVTNNTVSGSDVGIQVQGGNTANTQSTDYFDRGDAATGSALVNRNSLTGNGVGLRNTGGAANLDATRNWWGNASGPANAANPSGTGNSVVGSVVFSPWLCDGTDTSAARGFQPNVSNTSPCGVGPITSNVTVSPAIIASGAMVVVTATEDETTTGGSNIASASYSIDGGAPVALSAADGAFDEVVEGVTGSFAAPAAGFHTVCVSGVDQPGNSGAPVCVALVVFDREGGFVTGGGSFDSPSGAYTPGNSSDPNFAGKAEFQIEAKYKKNKAAPQGEFQFKLKSANLNFKSTSEDVLVVSGNLAQVRGQGKVNGAGGYSYLVTVVDNDKHDLVRIQIWNTATNVVLYDSQPGAPDSAAPTTPVNDGNLKVHHEHSDD